MESKIAACAICDLRHITKPSIVWCSECDEGLCLECNEHHGLSKATRCHIPVPISVYEKLPTNVCTKHKEQFQMYCNSHNQPCCIECVNAGHKECQEIIQLEDIVNNFKKSYGFHDIEQTVIDLVENIRRIGKSSQENLEQLKEQRKQIEKEIQETRMKINAQLDNLQESMIKELYAAEEEQSKTIRLLSTSIEMNEQKISEYQKTIVNIKQHGSDLQTFLVMKQIERDILATEEFVASLVKCDKLKKISLSCKINDALQKSIYELQTFGEVIIATQAPGFLIVRKKEKQAQTPLPLKPIDKLTCQLQKAVNTKLDIISGCTLLPDSRMVFSCCHQNRVRGFKLDASQDFDVFLPKHAFDVAYIQGNDTIAVTSRYSRCISIIDLQSLTVNRTIRMNSFLSGIVSRANTLICCTEDGGLRMVNLSDESKSSIITIPITLLSYVATAIFVKPDFKRAYVASFGDKLYYTNFFTHTVICCDLLGKAQWEFKNQNVLNCPLGISVDNDGNVYVVGYMSDNVVVISSDGQQHRELLSNKDCLYRPSVLHYDRSTNKLLVANQSGNAFLFKME